MKHIIIGTAGHIDHGKTTLIKALTGRETDTLKEEKVRGISINLGFTYFDLPSGNRAGIIDVPGHEKFIKNMLAGISGIDIVMLVIAADEGIMPQTTEHLEILQLLDIKKGLIVLTKTDMVDAEWLDMVKEEVKEELKDTFLSQSPIIPVSSKTGDGIEELIKYLDKASEEVEAKDTLGHFRMPIDRVFSISGFGTVVTGTIYGGRITLGETVEIYPSGAKGKVRNIQIHDRDMSFAEAGQRCAVNISGLKTDEVSRGNVLAKEGALVSSLMIDATLNYLKSAEKELVNRQRVRLYYGTEEVLCRVIILDKEELSPGCSAYVQLRLEKPVAMQRGDRYVIRSYSPMVTIGGGRVLEPVAQKAKRFNEEYIRNLKVKESGSTESIVEGIVERLSKEYPSSNEILKSLGKNQENLQQILESLVDNKRIIRLGNSANYIYIHNKFFMNKIQQARDLLSEFHKNNPLKRGLSKEEFKNKIFSKELKQKNYDEVLELLLRENIIKINGNSIALVDFEMVFNEEQEQIKNLIISEYKKAAFMPPRLEDISTDLKNKKEFKAVAEALLDQGEICKINEECMLYKDNFFEAKKRIIDFIKENGQITAAEYRNLLGTSRKYAVALLEYFDGVKLTKRVDDKRILL